VVTKLDRLARSVSHLVTIGERLEAKGVSLRVLEQAIDTSTSTGRLMFNMLGAIAQFEREIMLERQPEGIAKGKAEGKYKGRAPTARAKAIEVARLHDEGVGATEIGKRLGISRASVYRPSAAMAPQPEPKARSELGFGFWWKQKTGRRVKTGTRGYPATALRARFLIGLAH
jgi:DNA invertase Pin-like site-specific DNA recombinase